VSWCWLDIVGEPDPRALATTRVFEAGGAPAGWLTAWRRGARPTPGARRADARVVDPAGAAAWVSLVRAPGGLRLPFDDLTVQQARRRVLAGEPMDAVTTLLADASHFEGALTVARAERVARLPADPFARIFPARIMRVEAGVLGGVPAACGPVIERYGSANPWPSDRFTAR
jgi:hypothetical protein